MELAELEAEESLPLLARGGVDVAIAEEYEHAPRPHLPELHRDDLAADELVLTLPRGHGAAARRGAVRLGVAARRVPWAAARAGTNYADMFVRVCRIAGGFEPEIHHRVNDIRMLLDLVATGGVRRCCRRSGEPAEDGRVVVRPLVRGRSRARCSWRSAGRRPGAAVDGRRRRGARSPQVPAAAVVGCEWWRSSATGEEGLRDMWPRAAVRSSDGSDALKLSRFLAYARAPDGSACWSWRRWPPARPRASRSCPPLDDPVREVIEQLPFFLVEPPQLPDLRLPEGSTAPDPGADGRADRHRGADACAEPGAGGRLVVSGAASGAARTRRGRLMAAVRRARGAAGSRLTPYRAPGRAAALAPGDGAPFAGAGRRAPARPPPASPRAAPRRPGRHRSPRG